MNYCLYRLKFTTALHVGDSRGGPSLPSSQMSICADTLFSAICIESLQLGGESLLKEIYEHANSGKLLFSDLLPFSGEEYFIPKPILDIKMKDITKRHDSQNQQKKNKSFKKLEYISVSDLNNYLLAAKGEGDFNPDEAIEKSVFGISQIKVSTSVKGLKESLPYYIGTFVFNNDCGLYVIVAYESETERKLFERLLHLLSYSGIGGKRTSGLGKFEIDDCIYLDAPYTKSLEILSRMLKDKDSKIKITLSVSLPADNELDEVIPGGSFMLIRRGGFVQSQTYSDTPLKKKDIYAFSAGSCFKKSFNGDIYDVSLEGAHPVYRYIKPLFLGVNM